MSTCSKAAVDKRLKQQHRWIRVQMPLSRIDLSGERAFPLLRSSCLLRWIRLRLWNNSLLMLCHANEILQMNLWELSVTELETYRRIHRLRIPSASTRAFDQMLLRQGIGLYSPSSACRRAFQRISKAKLSEALCTHNASAQVHELDTISRLIMTARNCNFGSCESNEALP